MEIIILGTGCAKCNTLEKAVRDAVAELNIDVVVSKEEDIMKIMEYGIMRTPGLVKDGKVVISGRVPSPKEIRNILTS